MKVGDLVVYRPHRPNPWPAIIVSEPRHTPSCSYVTVCWVHNSCLTEYNVEFLEVISEGRRRCKT